MNDEWNVTPLRVVGYIFLAAGLVVGIWLFTCFYLIAFS